MSASRQKQHNLPRLQKTEDPSGAAMPTDPPAVASNRYDISTAAGGDRAQSPSSSSTSEEDEGAISSNTPFQQTTSHIFRKSEPSRSSHQSHQPHQSHLPAISVSGPDYKDNFDSNIVFADNVQPVPASVTTVNESHSQDEENAAPYMPPREVPVPSKTAPPLQEDGGRRCSKRTLIIAAVAAVVIIAGVVGGVVAATSNSNSSSDSQSSATGPITTDVPSMCTNRCPP